MTALPEEALADIPGWGGGVCTKLAGGLTNNTWRVDHNGQSGVLKIDEGARELPFNTRQDEARIQRTAAKAGLAPGVIMAGDGMYFTEYFEGTVWQPECLAKESNLELLAATLKRLHALPLTGRSIDATTAAKGYAERASGLDPNVIEQCTTTISSMRLPQNLCCCHNDLVAENLITTPDLKFLDWEYACDNDPFFDLATIVEHHELSNSQVEALLNAYFDGEGQQWRESLERQRKLYLSLLCLWMASRSECDPAELKNVLERLATSCS
jgi:thiamine kinase-like enzyme